jgi:EAL domain-containing protein (putative c-di-GMP-specific phosphodiesterase class I)
MGVDLTSTVESRVADRGEFAQALGRRMSARVVVYVPADAPARALWLSSVAGDDAQIGTLEEFGRAWLGARWTGETHASIPANLFITALEAAATGGTVGALLIAKEPGLTWTDAERDFARFGASYYAPAIDRRASWRPVPPVARWRTGPDLEQGMRAAFGNGELSLVYQPEVDLLTSDVVAVEALLRWHHPDFGDIGPETVVAVAERSGMLAELGGWVVAEAVAQLSRWRASQPGLKVEMRINAAPAQLTGDELVAAFEIALAAHDVPGRAVCVEITEVAHRDEHDLVRTLGRLKELGVRSALDDLAAGYSSLGRLRALPVDMVKIDRSLVAGLHSDARARTIVTSVLGMAGALGLETVAEGVEDEADAEVLRELGCWRAQGNLLGRPIPAAEMLALLAERGRRTAEK